LYSYSPANKVDMQMTKSEHAYIPVEVREKSDIV
jgi:hypothetical protein